MQDINPPSSNTKRMHKLNTFYWSRVCFAYVCYVHAPKTSRYQKNAGKKHIIPPYERTGGAATTTQGAARSGCGGGRQQSDRGTGGASLQSRPPFPSGPGQGPYDPSGGGGGRPVGPGSFLEGLGRQVAESGATGGVVFPLGTRRRESGAEAGEGAAAVTAELREEVSRRKELYATN